MNDLKPIVVPLACALGLTLLLSGCREDLGCPPGTVLVAGVCEAAPDMGTRRARRRRRRLHPYQLLS
jgi:hypothetical protein